jgi:hypothetical protein
MSLLLERPRCDFDEVEIVHVPAAFPRQVRNDPVRHINFHFIAPDVLRLPFLY